MSHDPEYSCGMPLEPAKTVLTQSGGMYFDQVDLDGNYLFLYFFFL